MTERSVSLFVGLYRNQKQKELFEFRAFTSDESVPTEQMVEYAIDQFWNYFSEQQKVFPSIVKLHERVVNSALRGRQTFSLLDVITFSWTYNTEPTSNLVVPDPVSDHSHSSGPRVDVGIRV